MSDPTGRIEESHTYDSQGRAITSSISEERESYTLSYTPQGTFVTDALGNVTAYHFAEIDLINRVIQIVGPCSLCGGGGSDVQDWTYDDAGRVIVHKDGDGKVTHYVYDPQTSDLVAVKDALLNSTIYTYHADGRVKTVTPPDGSTRHFSYVPAGLAAVTETILPGIARTSSIEYTPQGKPERLVDPRGKATTLSYNGFGDLVSTKPDGQQQPTTFTYDAMGRRLTATDPLGRTMTMSYDARGRIQRITNPDTTFVDFTYDLSGRQTSITDSTGRQTRSGYDRFGRLEGVIDPLGGVTSTEYDMMSRVIGVKNALGNVTRFDRDGHGRATRTTYPDGSIETLAYDNQGRLSTRTDRRGVVTTFTYDAIGRVLRKQYSDGRWESTNLPRTYPGLSRDRIQRGLDDLDKRFPNAARNAHTRARFACAYGDAAGTMKALEGVGLLWTDDAEPIWLTKENFEYCWQWASLKLQ